MAGGRSDKDFLEFLDWLGTKGLLPVNTAHARKAVANKVLAALEPSELLDVSVLDIEDVMLRFTNKFGKRYTLESLRTYRSRFESSISDFKSYCDNPVGFRPAGRQRSASQQNDKEEGVAPKRVLVRKLVRPKPESSETGGKDQARVSPSSVVPVQIREDVTVSIGPIPFDFTASEARRVANVILALAVVD